VRIGLSRPPPADVREGAIIRVRAVLGPLPPAVLPDGHDPVRRAWFEGVAASGRALAQPVLVHPAPPGDAPLGRLRAAIAGALQRLVPGDAGAVAVTLVVGEQGRVSDAVLDAMRVSGMAHLLTISGLHVAVVAGGVGIFVRMLAAMWPWLAVRVAPARIGAVAGGLAALFYVLLAGAEVPAVRSLITVWVVIAALLLGRDVLSLRLFAFAAFVILVVRPELLLDPSFQLSFGAVGALLVLAGSSLGRWLWRPPPGESRRRRLLRHLGGLIATGIAAELVLTPIALAHFGRSGVYGVLANLVAIPFTSFVIMPLEGLVLRAWPLGAGHWVAPLLGWSLDCLIRLAETVAGWPGAAVQVPAVPAVAYGLGVAGALLIALLAGRLRWVGAPLLAAGVAVAAWTRPPDLLIAPDGGQVGVVRAGGLYFWRGHRGGFLVRAWSEAVRAPPAGRIADLAGARCDTAGCRFAAGKDLRVYGGDPRGLSGCADLDLVVAPAGPGGACRPRWRVLTRADLVLSGAVAIRADARTIASVGARAGDHPWSPAASPGYVVDLLGRRRWIGVLSQ
jgi:competence protein ComEC